MKRMIPLLATLALTGCIGLDSIWFNGTAVDEYTLPFNGIPENQIEEVELAGTATDDDGAPTLFGIWAHPCPEAVGGGDCGTPRDDVKILYAHGNFHSIEEYWDRVQNLWRMGYSVFIIDYRGYGKSTGTSTEAGFFADGRTARDHVLERMDADDQLVIYGFSIGSAVATDVAAEFPPDVFILESALASGQAFVDDAIGVGFDQSVLMETEFDNLGKIPDIPSPKLLMHGRNDDFVRFEFSQLLFEAAREPKTFHANDGSHSSYPCPLTGVEGANSSVSPCVADKDYVEQVDDHINRTIRLD